MATSSHWRLLLFGDELGEVELRNAGDANGEEVVVVTLVVLVVVVVLDDDVVVVVVVGVV